MRTQQVSRADRMLLALAVWLCTLPIAFGIAFFFGIQAGFAAALASLLVLTALCWVLCGAQIIMRHLLRHRKWLAK